MARKRDLKTCPYCKIDFGKEPWAKEGPKNCLCYNCWNYANHYANHEKEEIEAKLYKVYKMLPYKWDESNEWRTDPQYFRDPE